MPHHDDAHNLLTNMRPDLAPHADEIISIVRSLSETLDREQRERQLLAWQYQAAFEMLDEMAMDVVLQRAEKDSVLWSMICDIHRQAIARLNLHQFTEQEHEQAYVFVKDIMERAAG